MREVTMAEIKHIELDMLKDIARFCDEHGLRYYLCGGTLLGAVRHKGFIPWDDDIDIMMPRPDYRRFMETYNGSNDRYEAKSIEIDDDYWLPHGKVIDTRTVSLGERMRIPTPGDGVGIDIFPEDGMPKKRWRQWLLFKEQWLLGVLYNGAVLDYRPSKHYVDSMKGNIGLRGKLRTVLKYVAITIMRPLPVGWLLRRLNRNGEKFDYDSADEVSMTMLNHYGMDKERMPRVQFEARQKFEFEGEEFWGTKLYDYYLSNLYGDYMTMPPKDRQVAHHDFTAFWKDNI